VCVKGGIAPAQNILRLDEEEHNDKVDDKVVKFVEQEEESPQQEVKMPVRRRGMRVGGEGVISRSLQVNQKDEALLVHGGKKGVSKVQRTFSKKELLVMRMQAWARGFIARRDVKNRKLKGLEWGLAQNAMRIQRWWRRYLHAVEMRKQRKAMTGAMSMGLFGPMKIRLLGKKWLRRTRDRLRRELEERCALVIQKHYRGMQGIKRFRRNKAQILYDACVSVQRAWRKKVEWIAFVKAEEQKALKEAKRLQKEYLFGGKSNAELKKMRGTALDEFEAQTSEFGRNKVHENQAAEAGISVTKASAMDTWMLTLKALMQKEKEKEGGVQSEEVKPKRAGGMAGVLTYTKSQNPQHVIDAIFDQRIEKHMGINTKLVLCKMEPKLLRWPFGVSDDQMGKPPWFALCTVYLSENKLKGLPHDFFKLTNLTDLRLDHNLFENVPATISQLSKLKSLWLHNNLIKTLPVEVSCLQELSFMSLNDNKIRWLPMEMATLSKVTKLPLENNVHIIVPPIEMANVSGTSEGCRKVLDFFGKFWKGQTEPFVVDLSGFGMINIPGIDRVKTSKTMNLSNNALTKIDEDFMWDTHYKVAWHHALTAIDLSSNKFKIFPHILTRLVTLCKIDMSNNEISDLPADIIFLTRLTTFKCEGCPLSSPPLTTVEDGVETYTILGSTEHSEAMGRYQKTDEWLNGRPVFELWKRANISKLYFAVNNGTPNWCVGPNTNTQDAFLCTIDGALLPSQVLSTWKESRPSTGTGKRRGVGVEKRMFRNAQIQVVGCGLQEYFSRIMTYRTAKNAAQKAKDAFQTNEEIAEVSGLLSDEQKKEMRTANRAKFKELTMKLSLDLSNLSIDSLPKELCDKGIRELILDNNVIEDLPEKLFSLPLVRFSANMNRLTVLDDDIGRLNLLEYLSLAGNFLTTLPETISTLGALNTLNLSKNDIGIIPEAVGKLPMLMHLDLTQNSVVEIPITLTSLNSLSSFKIMQNKLMSLALPLKSAHADACPLGDLYTITTLDLANNMLSEIPPPMRGLTMLRELIISNNRFVNLSLVSWNTLEVLQASGNRLRSLPADMSPLKSLEILDLSFNSFEKMPPGICFLGNLKTLLMRKNFIEAVPAEIGALRSLELLDFSENYLKHISPEVRFLTNLTTLHFEQNELGYLPPLIGMASQVLGNLCKLQTLDVSNNKLVFLPLDLRKCSNLTDLHVQGNPLQHPRMWLAQIPCIASLKVHLEQVSDIVFMNKLNQKARLPGNPLCTVGLEDDKSDDKSANAEQLHVTTCKCETDNPHFKQDFALFVRDCRKRIAIKLHTKPSTQERIVDHKADMTPLRGLAIEIPVLFPILYQQRIFNFFRNEAVCKCMEEGVSVLHYQAQEVIVSMGDKVNALFILIFGKISMSHTQDGREMFLSEMNTGSVVGEMSLLCGDPFALTLTASESCILVKVPMAAVSAVLKNEPDESVDCLLYHEAIEYYKTDIERQEAQKEFAWGSEKWQNFRKAENVAIQKRLAQVCHLHVFSHDQTNSAFSHLEIVANKMNDDGKPVFAHVKSLPPLDINIEVDFTSPPTEVETAGVVKSIENPRANLYIDFHCGDRVQSYMLAFRDIEDATEPDPYAIALLKQFTPMSVTRPRPTPDGIIFDTEGDWLRADAEVERVDAYMKQFLRDKALNRGKPVWEKMPFMFIVDGVFDKEWDRAGDRRSAYSSGNFADMANIVERMKVDSRVSDLIPKTPHRNQHLRRAIEHWSEGNYQRQSIPVEGEDSRFFKECPDFKSARVRSNALENWQVLVGLILVKPQALLDKEQALDLMAFNENQLANLRTQQEHSATKLQVRAIKSELGSVVEQIAEERAKIKQNFQLLEQNWDGDAVSNIKAARKVIDRLEIKYESLKQSKDRLKAMYQLRLSSSSALEWKRKQAMDAVWDSIEQYTDPYVDKVGSESNAQVLLWCNCVLLKPR
jgi:Leucine-rich repeat (LRR) protein